jgi:hypothetical protein
VPPGSAGFLAHQTYTLSLQIFMSTGDRMRGVPPSPGVAPLRSLTELPPFPISTGERLLSHGIRTGDQCKQGEAGSSK